MALSLIKNQRGDCFVIFEKRDGAIYCDSREIQIQSLFILSSLKKYKQITFLKVDEVPNQTTKINKHYQVSDDSITIQKSFLKFLQEKLSNLPNEPLSYQQLFSILA